MHWQRALEWLILHETPASGSSHAAELVCCSRAWPDASGTSPRDAPREPLRRDLSARPPRRERVGDRKMWGRGERRLSFAGKTGSDSVVHIPPYSSIPYSGVVERSEVGSRVGSEASPGNPVSFPGKHTPPPTPRLTSEVNRPRPRGDPTRPPLAAGRRLRVDVSHWSVRH